MVAAETLGSAATMVARSASGSDVIGGWFSSTGGRFFWASSGLGGSQVEQNMLRPRTSAASFEGGGLAVSCLTGLARRCGCAVLLSLPRRYLASTMWFTPSATRTAQMTIMKIGSVQNQRFK